jgi:hypothetical protein
MKTYEENIQAIPQMIVDARHLFFAKRAKRDANDPIWVEPLLTDAEHTQLFTMLIRQRFGKV